uniref:Uncharacterized protein n=1 Tax=Leersia perrieri TaxID=77586 RepID=A0A0D9VNB2_9ORYZ
MDNNHLYFHDPQQIMSPVHHDTKPPPFAAAAALPFEQPASDDSSTAVVVDQVAQAAKLAESGDLFAARQILNRPPHRLPAAATPLLRSAFYFNDALRAALSSSSPPPAASTPVDVLLKLTAYKAFSDASPVLRFAHFTCVQALLDELASSSATCIHVLDFDIAVGDQWASLMHDLAHRRQHAAFKLTALVTTASHHPLELHLLHHTLSTLAADLGVPFRFAVFNLDATDLTALLSLAAAGDAIAVRLPVGSVHASVLHLLRRLGARLVVSVDRGWWCERGELPFAAHIMQALQSTAFLLDSLDAVGTDSDVAAKIERFWVRPRIDDCVRAATAGCGEKTAAWRATLASAGFVPVQVSGLAEAQAESLLKKMAVRGFRLERRGGSLFLHWQRGLLASVSAWRC